MLGGTLKDGTGIEKVTIASKDDDTKTVTLESAVEHWHYGHAHSTVGLTDDNEVKIDPKYGNGLDLRSSVGHITRNIKITATNEDDLGGHF